jgi:hypothetical protein
MLCKHASLHSVQIHTVKHTKFSGSKQSYGIILRLKEFLNLNIHEKIITTLKAILNINITLDTALEANYYSCITIEVWLCVDHTVFVFPLFRDRS